MSTKEEYKQRLQQELDHAQEKLKELQGRLGSATDEAKAALQKQVGELEQSVDAAKAKVKELGSASEEAWEHLKHDAEGLWGKFSTAIKDTASRLRGGPDQH